MGNKDRKVKFTNILFIVYLIAVIWIVIFKFDIPFINTGYLRSINLIPFGESLIINGKLALREIVMNIVIFIPCGIYISLIFSNWSLGKKILSFIIVSLICEVLQFIFGVGASDITDIINNSLGGIFGILIYKVIVKIFKSSEKSHKFINIIAAIGTIGMIILLLLLVLSNL